MYSGLIAVMVLFLLLAMAMSSAFLDHSPLSTAELDTTTTQQRYRSVAYTKEPIQTRAAALDEDETTTAASEKQTRAATKSIRARRAPLRGSLVCTVGVKLNRSLPLPDDGLCDFTFFDSLQRDGANELGGPFEDNFRHFLRHAAEHATTDYGVGFDYNAFEEMDDILSDSSTKAHLDSLWDQRIFHFGYINTPFSDFSHDKFTQLMEILKTVSSMMRDRSGGDHPSYTVLVAAMHSDLWIKHATHVFRDTFEPDAVVLVGHRSGRDHSESVGCEILPPTTLERFTRHGSPSLRDAHMTVRKLHTRDIQSALFVSVAMFGRWYKPRYQNAEVRARSGSQGGFGFLQKCRHDSGEALGSPVQVCRDSAYVVTYHKTEPQGALAYNRKAGKLLAYDSAGSLEHKLCVARTNVSVANYGLAAFNVEYEDCTDHCGQGSFSRLRVLKDLLNAFNARNFSATTMEQCAV
ncbi:uncharacterized protein LOC144107837 isoform X2 [Amblyomma americanum]